MSVTRRLLVAIVVASALFGCSLLGPAAMPTAATNPLAGVTTVGTTTIIPAGAPTGVGLWAALKGETAKAMLTRWARVAGYAVEWRAGSDNVVAANAAITGSFADAVSIAFNEGWPNVTPRLRPEIHTENNVVVVTQDTP